MSATPYAIQVEDLHQSFGTVKAVQGLNFTVQPGEVVGFIGANGAGKTSTMRMMTTLSLPDKGRILIHGTDVVHSPDKTRQQVGWMPDHFGTYPNLDVQDYLDFYARAFGLKGSERRERMQEVMAFTDLDVLAERPCNKLSKGMTQRLSLGRTLLSDPDVLVLDEPAAGLDPKARLEFKNLISLLKERGKTIFISSHILSELAEMCDRLLFIDQGKLIHYGTAESLKYQQGKRLQIRVEVKGPPEKLHHWVSLNPKLDLQENVDKGTVLLLNQEPDMDTDTALHLLLRAMLDAGLEVYEFHRLQQNLEQAFIDILSNDSPQPPELP